MTTLFENVVGANLTKGKAILNDSKMWHWIAKQTRKLRRKVFEGEYFDYLNIPLADQPFCQRYVCQYAGDFCRRCPINWGDNEDCCGTPFHEWELCDDWERAAELADQNAKFLRKQYWLNMRNSIKNRVTGKVTR